MNYLKVKINSNNISFSSNSKDSTSRSAREKRNANFPSFTPRNSGTHSNFSSRPLQNETSFSSSNRKQVLNFGRNTIQSLDESDLLRREASGQVSTQLSLDKAQILPHSPTVESHIDNKDKPNDNYSHDDINSWKEHSVMLARPAMYNKRKKTFHPSFTSVSENVWDLKTSFSAKLRDKRSNYPISTLVTPPSSTHNKYQKDVYPFWKTITTSPPMTSTQIYFNRGAMTGSSLLNQNRFSATSDNYNNSFNHDKQWGGSDDGVPNWNKFANIGSSVNMPNVNLNVISHPQTEEVGPFKESGVSENRNRDSFLNVSENGSFIGDTVVGAHANWCLDSHHYVSKLCP